MNAFTRRRCVFQKDLLLQYKEDKNSQVQKHNNKLNIKKYVYA